MPSEREDLVCVLRFAQPLAQQAKPTMDELAAPFTVFERRISLAPAADDLKGYRPAWRKARKKLEPISQRFRSGPGLFRGLAAQLDGAECRRHGVGR